MISLGMKSDEKGRGCTYARPRAVTKWFIATGRQLLEVLIQHSLGPEFIHVRAPSLRIVVDIREHHKHGLITLDLVFTSNYHGPIRRVVALSCEGKPGRGRVQAQGFLQTGFDIDKSTHVIRLDGLGANHGVDFVSYFGIGIGVFEDKSKEEP